MCIYIIEFKVNSNSSKWFNVTHEPHGRRKLAENVHENIQLRFVCMLDLLAFAFSLSSSGRGRVDICSLPTKSRKSLTHDVFDMFATNACLVDDNSTAGYE